MLDGDPFLLSSTTVHSCGRMNDARALVIAVGLGSQWGKIKAQLDVENEDTPLQVKLTHMADLIGYGGGGAAFLTFVAMIVTGLVGQCRVLLSFFLTRLPAQRVAAPCV
jgi:Ca2+-transporting ATPase